MKRMKWLILAAGMLTGISCLAFEEGTDRGNGGDEYANAFINQALDVAEGLVQNPIPGVDAHAFQLAVQNTYVNSQETLILRGNEVDAINYPDPQSPRIIVSRTGWDRLETTPHRRAFLVLHEYLGIMGVDDSRYQISNHLDRAGVCERSAPVRNAIEMELRKSCYRIIQDDLKYVTGIWMRDEQKFDPVKSDFRGLPNLTALSFRYRSLNTLPANLFELVPKLDSLSFDGALPTLEDCGFLSRLPKLHSLDFGYLRSNRAGPSYYFEKIQSGCFAFNHQLLHLNMLIDAQAIGSSDFLYGIGGDPDLRLTFRLIHTRSLNAEVLRPAANAAPRIEIYSDDAEDFPVDVMVKIQDVLPNHRCVLSVNPNNWPKHLYECNQE